WSPEAAPLFELPRGVQVDLVEKQIVVSNVVAGSAAEKAGVKRGMVVTKVDGEAPPQRLEKIAEYERLYDGLPAERHRYFRAANQILAGAPHSKATISFMDENQKVLEGTVGRESLELS